MGVYWAAEDVVKTVFLRSLDNLVHDYPDKAFVFHFQPAEVEYIHKQTSGVSIPKLNKCKVAFPEAI